MTDLIEELRDGHVLLSLLEVLLGTMLVSLFIDNACLPISGSCSRKRNSFITPAYVFSSLIL